MTILSGLPSLFLTSFLAATFLPLSSEAHFYYALKSNPAWLTLIVATVGNSLGGLFNYWIGHLAKIEWAKKYLGIKESTLSKVEKYTTKHQEFLAFFCFLPVFGDVIAFSLGIMKVSFYRVALFLTLGKFARYLVILFLENSLN
ncbi:SNARE-like domain protein [Bacteriovorax sp. BSW11_IV]|uniref:YqaA family protein n=1 Tax=Bacteriovorax sp. BSW11_IV TaxID=1353529 RepID=UPI00038A3719|nr:VTT domain-containing protein [Bacteriovorax sp. BSW11_IV]EQC48281.1 SNARE-like domain protein [Bacteriovorax sp. BSW11_IV]